MKTTFTAKELMVVAVDQIARFNRDQMNKRAARKKKWATAKMKREVWKNADTFRRTVE